MADPLARSPLSPLLVSVVSRLFGPLSCIKAVQAPEVSGWVMCLFLALPLRGTPSHRILVASVITCPPPPSSRYCATLSSRALPYYTVPTVSSCNHGAQVGRKIEKRTRPWKAPACGVEPKPQTDPRFTRGWERRGLRLDRRDANRGN